MIGTAKRWREASFRQRFVLPSCADTMGPAESQCPLCEKDMETLRLQTVIGPDGKVRIEVPGVFPPGPAEVLVVVAPAGSGEKPFHWRDYYGFAKELWRGDDSQEFLNRLRDEWER